MPGYATVAQGEIFDSCPHVHLACSTLSLRNHGFAIGRCSSVSGSDVDYQNVIFHNFKTGGYVSDLDHSVLEQMARFLASSNVENNWLALLDEMANRLDSKE
jgi:hypothetical protein